MSGGDENEEAGGYATRSRTPSRGAPLGEANVNELVAPNSTAKLATFKGR